MGNTNTSNDLQKGQGYRIISIKPNSPFEGKVDLFFDFIVEVIPPPIEKSPAQILDKLAGPQRRGIPKSPLQVLNENVDKSVQIKIVSTKYRKVRTIEVTPNNKWGGENDRIGINVRRERFDQAFQTYFPVVQVKANSPIRKAGVREGQYLIGCVEYSYSSLDAFMEGLYQKFFDRESKDKLVHLAVYDIASDTLALREVVLSRGWGGKGLLGCEFLQGMLNKFPTNLEEQREEMLKREAKKSETLKLRNELGECDGASRLLVEALQNQKSKKQRHYKNLRNLLNIEPPKLTQLNKIENIKLQQNAQEQDKDARIEGLQKRVGALEHSLQTILRFIEHQQLQEGEIQS